MARRPAPSGRLRRRLAIGGAAVLAVTGLSVGALLTLPVPGVDDYLTRTVRARVTAGLSCPGRPAPDVTVGGGAVLDQLLSDRLAEVRVSAPDVAVGGADHARLETTLRGITGLREPVQRAETLESTVTIGYDDLPAPGSGPTATLSRAEDGRLAMTLLTPKEQSDRTTSVLVLALRLDGAAIEAVPEEFRVFRRSVPLEEVALLTGGVRTTKLPALPAGLRYTSVSAQPDGVHVGLDGTVVTPLSTLPTRSGGRTVSYTARGGRLGIRATQDVLGLFDVPLTIWTRPVLRAGRLDLVPQTVEVLGEDRPPSDPLAQAVLDRTDRSSLGRTLPALPPGVRYVSAAVGAAGLEVVVRGATVRPFSELPSPVPGVRSTFGAEDGRLTVTTTGTPGGIPVPLRILATPRIDGTTLTLEPETVELFGVGFDPDAVFDETGGAPGTTFPLEPLAAGLSYTQVEALDDGLRFTVRGEDVVLGDDLMGSCPAPAGPAAG